MLLNAISYLYENIERRGDVKHADFRNLPEFTQDMNVIRRRLLQRYTAEERLEGLSTEERLEGLSPEELTKKLSPEELRKRLSTGERLEGLSPEEPAKELSPEKLAKLPKLLASQR